MIIVASKDLLLIRVKSRRCSPEKRRVDSDHTLAHEADKEIDPKGRTKDGPKARLSDGGPSCADIS